MEPHEARTGTTVRVKEGYRKRDLVGMRGTVRECWGHPDYSAVDIELEDGRSELLWFHELEVVGGAKPLPALNGSCVGSRGMVAKAENETTQEARLPKDYRLDEPDPGVVVLLRDDGDFVAAFITGDATREGILQAAREAAREDRAALIKQRA